METKKKTSVSGKIRDSKNASAFSNCGNTCKIDIRSQKEKKSK
jgi:hypothetical protein